MGEINGNGSRVRELARSEVLAIVGLAVVIGGFVWGMAVWLLGVQRDASQAAESSKVIAQLQLGLQQSTSAVDEIRKTLDVQRETLSRVVAFMDEQTQGRRFLGAQEKKRRELCRAGDLRPALCQALPTDAEIEAMLR